MPPESALRLIAANAITKLVMLRTAKYESDRGMYLPGLIMKIYRRFLK